jgi:hypothetical protein
MEIQNYRLNTDMTYAAFSLIRGLDTSHVLKGYLMFVKGGIMTIKFNMLIWYNFLRNVAVSFFIFV